MGTPKKADEFDLEVLKNSPYALVLVGHLYLSQYVEYASLYCTLRICPIVVG